MTPRYRLRTLLIFLAILPPLLAVGWWKYSAWKAERERLRSLAAEQGGRGILLTGLKTLRPDSEAPPPDGPP